MKEDNFKEKILTNPLVSILIPTKNSDYVLGKCLKSIKEQSYKQIEIFVVDNNSTDDTVKIAEKFSTKISVSTQERTGAKNFALNHCNGKYALFIDSDMELSKNVVENCVLLAEKNEKIGGIIIPEITVGEGYWIRVRAFERKISLNSDLESARFFNVKLAQGVGGFDEDVIFYEESTLPQKLELDGYNVKLRIDDVIFHHEKKLNLNKWVKKKRYYGKSLQEYLPKYKSYGGKQISIRYRMHIFRTNGGWDLIKKIHLTTGIFILKSLEYIAIKFFNK